MYLKGAGCGSTFATYASKSRVRRRGTWSNPSPRAKVFDVGDGGGSGQVGVNGVDARSTWRSLSVFGDTEAAVGLLQRLFDGNPYRRDVGPEARLYEFLEDDGLCYGNAEVIRDVVRYIAK